MFIYADTSRKIKLFNNKYKQRQLWSADINIRLKFVLTWCIREIIDSVVNLYYTDLYTSFFCLKQIAAVKAETNITCKLSSGLLKSKT